MSNFVRNSLSSVLNKVMNIGLTFITLILVARGLGPNGQGEYSLLVQSARVFFYFFAFGYPLSMIFYYNRFKHIERDHLNTFFVIHITLILLALAGFYGFAHFGYSYFFSGIHFHELIACLVSIGGWFATSYVSSVYVAIQNFQRRNLIQVTQPIILFILIAALYLLGELTVLKAILSYAISMWGSFVFGCWHLFKDGVLNKILEGKIDKSILQRASKYAVKNYVGRVAEFLIYRVDIYLIAYYMNKSALGVYVIAVNIVERLWMVSESVSMVLFAKLSITSGEVEKNHFSSYALRINFLMSLLGGLGVLIFIKLFISLFFGEEYRKSSLFVIILLPGVVLQSVSMMMKKILEARGSPGTNAIASVVCLVLNVAFNMFLIPRYGVEGAAYATSLTYMIFFFIQASSLSRKFGIRKRSYLMVRGQDFVDVYKLLTKRRA